MSAKVWHFNFEILCSNSFGSVTQFFNNKNIDSIETLHLKNVLLSFTVGSWGVMLNNFRYVISSRMKILMLILVIGFLSNKRNQLAVWQGKTRQLMHLNRWQMFPTAPCIIVFGESYAHFTEIFFYIKHATETEA